MAIAAIAEVIVNIFNDEEEDDEEICERHYQLQNDRIYLRYHKPIYLTSSVFQKIYLRDS